MKGVLIICYLILSLLGFVKAADTGNEFFKALCSFGVIVTICYAMWSWILYEINKVNYN